jgi:hypothetical protein
VSRKEYFLRGLLYDSGTLIIIKIFIYLKHRKFNLNIMFALNFEIIYLFEFSILIESVKSNVLEIRLLCVIKY